MPDLPPLRLLYTVVRPPSNNLIACKPTSVGRIVEAPSALPNPLNGKVFGRALVAEARKNCGLPWASLRRRGFDNYRDMLAGLGALGLLDTDASPLNARGRRCVRMRHSELARRGIAAHTTVHVTVEFADETPAIARLAQAGRAFGWLAEEPDLYADSDIVARAR